MKNNNQVKKVKIATWTELQDRKPAYAMIADVDLVRFSIFCNDKSFQ